MNEWNSHHSHLRLHVVPPPLEHALAHPSTHRLKKKKKRREKKRRNKKKKEKEVDVDVIRYSL